MKSVALKAYFQAERDTCNQMVASVRHQYPNLNLDDFNWFLTDCLDPVVLSLDSQSNQITFHVAHAGFKYGLELACFNWLKSETKKAILFKVWNDLYPRVDSVLKESPSELFAGTSNSLNNILAFGEDKLNVWLDLMIKSCDEINSIEQFKIIGIVSAWLAGLAQYREIALQKINELPDVVTRKLFKLSDSHDLNYHFDQLKTSRWFEPQQIKTSKTGTEIREKYRIGHCSLVGGDFPLPPNVFVEDDLLYVISDTHIWRLYADSFGATLIPSDNLQPEELKQIDQQISNNSALRSLGRFSDLTDINSVAQLDDTLVFTSPETFSVIITECSEPSVLKKSKRGWT
mgnify:CR=1 FL=1|tara:strand:+ start:14035 stop:15069 length:1035 start_codon:yes stop_codon:yes gene_type:complete